MSSIFILCLDSLADYKGPFLDCGSEFSEGRYQISVRKCWGLCPSAQTHPQGVCEKGAPRNPLFAMQG